MSTMKYRIPAGTLCWTFKEYPPQNHDMGTKPIRTEQDLIYEMEDELILPLNPRTRKTYAYFKLPRHREKNPYGYVCLAVKWTDVQGTVER